MATVVAASGSVTDINDAMTSASDGDVVTIPAGTWSHSGTTGPALTISKAITLQGAGVGNTIIRDSVLSGRMWTVTLKANLTTRITGIEFNNDARTATNNNGIFGIDGQAGGGVLDDRRIRIDHCKFTMHVGSLTIRVDKAYGVIDHNEFINSINFIYVINTTDYAWADARWAEATNWGGENFIFIENNTFTRNGAGGALVDSFGGGRYVARYNVTSGGHWEAHGTESSGRTRGTRAVEAYYNTMSGPIPGNCIVNLRSGTALVHHNTLSGISGTPRSVTPLNERCLDSFTPFGSTDGINEWDDNAVGNPVETHTVTAGTTEAGTNKVEAAAAWTVDEWKGYIIRKTSPVGPYNIPIAGIDTTNDRITLVGHGLVVNDQVHFTNNVGSTPALMGAYRVKEVVDANTITLKSTTSETLINFTVEGTGGYAYIAGSARNCSAPILSNTVNQITYAAAFVSAAQNMQFAIGDTFEINLVEQALDQPGVSGGTNLNGVNPPPLQAFDQDVDPIYEWENYDDGVKMIIANPVRVEYSLQILHGTHYFVDTEAPGYTPYTYPHPLTVEAGEEPTVSGNVSRMRLRRIG